MQLYSIYLLALYVLFRFNGNLYTDLYHVDTGMLYLSIYNSRHIINFDVFVIIINNFNIILNKDCESGHIYLKFSLRKSPYINSLLGDFP